MSTSERGANEPLTVASPNEDVSGDDHTEEPLGGYDTYLEISEAERALLKERIAEANKGIFISSEAMMRWVKDLFDGKKTLPPEPDVFLPVAHNNA